MGKSVSGQPTVICLSADTTFTIHTIGSVQYTSAWCHFPRCCDEYILYFIESGDLYVEEDGVRWHAGPNTALLLEPGKHHVGYQSATVCYYFIHFTCSRPLRPGIFTEDIREQIVQLHRNMLNTAYIHQWEPGPYDSAPLFFPKLAALGASYNYFQSLSDAKALFFDGLEGRRTLLSMRLGELLIMMCREFAQTCISPGSTRALVLVRDIRLYLDGCFTQPIGSQDISDQFHINYDYANRLFKKHTGQSIHNYLISVRIHRAKRLLTAGSSVTEAANQVGISDIAYFSRLFKKHTGLSPSEYADARGYVNWER